MADNNTLSIRRSELRSLYNKLYTRNTKFAELFQNEIGYVDNFSSPQLSQKNETATEVSPYEVQDVVLANALTSALDDRVPVKMYSQKLADKAKFEVNEALDSWDLATESLEVAAGNDKFIVIKADYETPKGITSFFIPVVVNKNKLEASVFIGNSGPQELNHTALKTYLTTFAGNKLNVSGSVILDAITTAAKENREISAAEIALTKLNASNTFFDQQSDLKKTLASIGAAELPKSKEFESFEKQFESLHGQATYRFGEDKVALSRENIVRELTLFGHRNPQVVVGKSDDNTIFYNVSLDAGKIGFVVPVKIAAGKIVKPTIMICNGSISEFNQSSINDLYVSNSTDYKASASASPQFDLKPSDLINNIRKAVADENYAMAEDALNVLATSGDLKAYASGFEIYKSSLANKKVVAEKTCNMILKNSSTEHPVCGHTGLPVHKTYVDKHGNCLPLYRRAMAETYEGVSFNNSKIFG